MKDQTMKWLFLTEHEANSVRKHLRKLYREKDSAVYQVWLVQPDGSLFVKGEGNEEFPRYEEVVEKGLFEINALLGNADYFDSHVEELENWLQVHPALKIRFMKARTARDQKQNRILRSCKSIVDQDVEEMRNPSKQCSMPGAYVKRAAKEN